MKGRDILLDALNGAEAAALMVDGRLDDLFISSDAPPPGTIYRARADRPVKGQGGMFVTTPDGPAFLRQVKGLAPGDPLLVQVSGYAEPGKAMPVTTRLLFKSRYVIVTPDAPGLNISRQIRDDDLRDELTVLAREAMGDSAQGLILRSSCAEAHADDIADDLHSMIEIAGAVSADLSGPPEKLLDGPGPHDLAWREWTDPAQVFNEPGAFADHGVLDALDSAQGPVERLAGGGTLYIEPTRALIAVDVNTGADSSHAAGLKANLACARALPRALRLRGLSGQITLDLAPMAKKERRGFETALRAAFKADPVETALVGWTPLGHYELQRKRDRVPLNGWT